MHKIVRSPKMKAHFHKVPIKLENSFSIRKDVAPKFGSIWHYHPELELHFVKKGEGVRFIGDNVSNFEAGEMILLGSNLPHSWRCNDNPNTNEDPANIEANIIHFLPYCLGTDFLTISECSHLNNLFETAKKGMVILGKTKIEITSLFDEAFKSKNLSRVIIFMKILHILAESDEYETIASADQFYKADQFDFERITRVCSFTLTHFKKDITLQEMAKLSNLSVTSFCRYFKLITKKTFYDFLTEIRISHSCRLLNEHEMTIQNICEECGFHNTSNFYRHFKKVVGVTPLQYKKQRHSSI